MCVSVSGLGAQVLRVCGLCARILLKFNLVNDIISTFICFCQKFIHNCIHNAHLPQSALRFAAKQKVRLFATKCEIQIKTDFMFLFQLPEQHYLCLFPKQISSIRYDCSELFFIGHLTTPPTRNITSKFSFLFVIILNKAQKRLVGCLYCCCCCNLGQTAVWQHFSFVTLSANNSFLAQFA